MSDFFIVRKPAAVWTAENPVLPENNIGVETSLVDGVEVDTLKAKLFDGVHSWAQLGYWSPGGAAGAGDVVGPASSTSGDIATFDGVTGKLIQDGGMLLPASSGTVGYLNIPQNAQAADYTLVLADAGKHIYHASGAGASDDYTIPANGTVAFPLGTAVTFVNMDTNSITVIITSDTLNYVNVGPITTLTIPQYNEATVLKTGTTEWLASGSAGCTTA